MVDSVHLEFFDSFLVSTQLPDAANSVMLR